MRRAISAGLVIACLMGASYVFGAVSDFQGFWPIPDLKALKQTGTAFVPANGAIGDKYNRLVSFRDKEKVECPEQTDRTMVLLLVGQSNAANSGGQRYIGRPDVINFFDSKCYAASSPLLGTSGIGGEAWTLLGNKLVEGQIADRVVLVPAAISGSSISLWREGGSFYPMLDGVLAALKPRYTLTHVLWHQGETDFEDGMTKSEYIDSFVSMVALLRKTGVKAPIYVSITTRCDPVNPIWRADNPIAEAQKALVDPSKKILAGVDTDLLVGSFDRTDDCHFAQSGQEKFAEAWIDILRGWRSEH
jgi:hypothetical protein